MYLSVKANQAKNERMDQYVLCMHRHCPPLTFSVQPPRKRRLQPDALKDSDITLPLYNYVQRNSTQNMCADLGQNPRRH